MLFRLSACALFPAEYKGTHQNDLGLVELFLYLHDGIRLLGVLVLCEIVCEGALELALLCGGQATGSGLGGVAAERVGGGGAEGGGCGLVGEAGEEGGVLVEDLGEEGECGAEGVLEVGDHDGCGGLEAGGVGTRRDAPARPGPPGVRPEVTKTCAL